MSSAKIVMPCPELLLLHLLLDWPTLPGCAEPGISKVTQPLPPQWPSWCIFWSVLSSNYVIFKPAAVHSQSFAVCFSALETCSLLSFTDSPFYMRFGFVCFSCVCFMRLFVPLSAIITASQKAQSVNTAIPLSSKIKVLFTFHPLSIKHHLC